MAWSCFLCFSRIPTSFSHIQSTLVQHSPALAYWSDVQWYPTSCLDHLGSVRTSVARSSRWVIGTVMDLSPVTKCTGAAIHWIHFFWLFWWLSDKSSLLIILHYFFLYFSCVSFSCLDSGKFFAQTMCISSKNAKNPRRKDVWSWHLPATGTICTLGCVDRNLNSDVWMNPDSAWSKNDDPIPWSDATVRWCHVCWCGKYIYI